MEETISKWIKTMYENGLDVENHKSHSTRNASTLVSQQAKLDMEAILQTAR